MYNSIQKTVSKKLKRTQKVETKMLTTKIPKHKITTKDSSTVVECKDPSKYSSKNSCKVTQNTQS